MTSRIRALNEQLFQDVQQNKKVTTRKILTDLTKLRRELRKCINKNICLVTVYPQLFYNWIVFSHARLVKVVGAFAHMGMELIVFQSLEAGR